MKTNLQNILNRLKIVHPYLFAAYGVLTLFANNIASIDRSAIRSLLFALLGAILIFIFFRIWLRDSLKAGLVSSAAILLFFSYGHVQSLLQNIPLLGWLASDYLLGIVWLVILVSWFYWVKRKAETTLEPINAYLNWVGLILMAFPLFTIWNFSKQASLIEPWIPEALPYIWEANGVLDLDKTLHAPEQNPQPDIYYIILDAYARADILEEVYGYDNSAFIHYLQSRGFYIAAQSMANYPDTLPSISSSLNMSQINTIPDFFEEKTGTHAGWVVTRTTQELIYHNLVGKTLQSQGYTFVTLESGYTQAKDADIHLQPGNLNEVDFWQLGFETLLFDTTIGELLNQIRGENPTLNQLIATHRTRILYSLDHLPDYAGTEGNYFVFAHLLIPHTPFIFGPNGEELSQEDPYTLMDLHPGNPDNLRLYRGQVNYVNTRMMEVLDEILAKSEVPPIIIIQGDHSGKVFAGEQPEGVELMKIHFPNLNAYLFPGHTDSLYPTITPVNSFRILFNEYFGAELDLLKDSSYEYGTLASGGKFVDICEIYVDCTSE